MSYRVFSTSMTHFFKGSVVHPKVPRLDWSIVDLTLISRGSEGIRSFPLLCVLSSSHSEPSPQKPSIREKRNSEKVTCKNKTLQTPLYIHFNKNVCRFSNCRCIRTYSYCGDGHPGSVCPCRTRPVKTK